MTVLILGSLTPDCKVLHTIFDTTISGPTALPL